MRRAHVIDGIGMIVHSRIKKSIESLECKTIASNLLKTYF